MLLANLEDFAYATLSTRRAVLAAMIVFKEAQQKWARRILKALELAGSSYVDDHDILALEIEGQAFLDNFEQIQFLAEAGLVQLDTHARPGHTCVSITKKGLDWLAIDARGDYSEELVEWSILEILKAADETGNERVHKAQLEASLRQHNPSLKLVTDNTVLARTRYLVDKGLVDWKPVRGDGTIMTYFCWITAAGQDELRRRPIPSSPKQASRAARTATGTASPGPDFAYIHRLELEGLACFEQAELEFQYPGRTVPGTQTPSALPGLENLNLIVGDNGSGKTTILKGIALAFLGGVLPHEGFRSSWFVRAKRESGRSTAVLHTSAGEESLAVTLARKGPEAEILQHWSSSLHGSNPSDLWFQNGPEYFLSGYGVNSRRAERDENYDQSLRDKSRGFRYQRVAALFEEGYSLKPISSLFFELSGARNGGPSPHLEEAMEILNLLLANTGVSWPGGVLDRSMLFKLPDGVNVPVHSLSDGFRGFLAFIGDLLSNLVEVSTTALRATPGVVLVDEIDQHLHPKWQRSVLSTLAQVFPKLQFIVTSHSPILVGCLPPENIYVSERDEQGRVHVRPADQDLRGRMVDEILLSPYFQLPSTLEPKLAQERDNLIRQRVRLGHDYLRTKSPEAAEAYLASLTEKVE